MLAATGYFFAVPAPKMLSALTGEGFGISIGQLLSAFILAMVVWTGIAVILGNALGDNVPLGRLLHQIP
jgi:hypothetical protein